MVDEWPELEKEVPSFDVLYQHVLGFSEEGLDDEETIVFCLVDG